MNGIRVTAEDLETGEKETQEITDDYVIITAGSCYVDGIQTYPGTGTHVLTVKRTGPDNNAAARSTPAAA
jgi:hypothetical protein